jgi:hypothetical protein
MRFDIPKAANIKITVFWDVEPSSLVDTNVSEESFATMFKVEG